MQIIQYTEEMNMKIYKFFQKVFKENARSFSPLGKDSDILDISKNYIIDGSFWCLINEKKCLQCYYYNILFLRSHLPRRCAEQQVHLTLLRLLADYNYYLLNNLLQYLKDLFHTHTLDISLIQRNDVFHNSL